jgi:hypothetical protein
MKPRIDKIGKSEQGPKATNQAIPPAYKKQTDETYIEINRTSFIQNFKYLIGHCKQNSSPSRVQKGA